MKGNALRGVTLGRIEMRVLLPEHSAQHGLKLHENVFSFLHQEFA